jgi:hypothetical protein
MTVRIANQHRAIDTLDSCCIPPDAFSGVSWIISSDRPVHVDPAARSVGNPLWLPQIEDELVSGEPHTPVPRVAVDPSKSKAFIEHTRGRER